MNRIAYRAVLMACAAGAGIAADRPAQACGGCFSPPREVTVVTDHRMAFAVSPQQSVLWDQIEYTGNPKDFSWVLPVKSGTVVQLSSDQWFAALDAVTSPTIASPNRPCNGNGGGCGAGGAKSASFAANGGTATDSNTVQVLSQTVVGPYDQATLRATDPKALENWLAANGYVLPDTIRPTVSAYVAGGFDFIALRLQPGEGVQAMQPVRVVTQGSDLTLPLRMVAAGVGAQVGVTLYVVSEGRYEVTAPFSNATIDESKLVWFHAQNRSNYQELSQSIMQQNGGRTWLTEYAQPQPVGAGDPIGCSQPGSSSYYGVGQIYLNSCCPFVPGSSSGSSGGFTSMGPFLDAATGAATDASNEAASEAGDDASVGAVSEAAATEAATSEAAASQDAASGDAQGHQSPASTSSPTCTGDDLGVALTGLHRSSVWVTRLRALIPANALSEHDLVLQASSSQTQVSSNHTTNTYDDPSYTPCGTTGGGGCAASGSDPHGLGPWLEGGALCVLAAAGLRRKRVRGRSSRS
jgi:hypothetical protein